MQLSFELCKQRLDGVAVRCDGRASYVQILTRLVAARFFCSTRPAECVVRSRAA